MTQKKSIKHQHAAITKEKAKLYCKDLIRSLEACDWNEQVDKLSKMLTYENRNNPAIQAFFRQVVAETKAMIPQRIKDELRLHLRPFAEKEREDIINNLFDDDQQNTITMENGTGDQQEINNTEAAGNDEQDP